MPTVDFANWAAADLVLPFGGRTYKVRPPSVGQAKLILALAIVSEVNLRLHPGPVPEDVQALLSELGEAGTPLGDVSLGEDVHRQMQEDGIPVETIRRMAYYAVHFWARGQLRADAIAKFLWEDSDEGDASGGASGRRRPKSGLRMVSVNRMPTAGTTTTTSPAP